MDTTLSASLQLILLVPPLLLLLSALVYSQLTLRHQLRREKQRLRESPRITKGNRRLYIIDPEDRN